MAPSIGYVCLEWATVFLFESSKGSGCLKDGSVRRLFAGFAASLLVLLTVCLVGCGGSNEPVLGSAVEHYLAAQDALAKGDKETALKELDISLSQQPDVWAYFERAQLHAKAGQDDKAKADCGAGLKLDEKHTGLKWLQGELKKPADRRFKGKNANPPVTK